MEALFEMPKVVHRRKNGQYATKEVAYADKIAEENELLKYEKEKYQRMAMALANENKKLKEKLSQIKLLL